MKVYLNVPGEGRQGFTFDPEIRVLPGWGGNNLVLARPRFRPDRGVTSQLSAGVSGKLLSATDRNGNRVTFTEAGITSADVEVTIARDAAGRLLVTMYPNGVSETRHYDALDRIVAIDTASSAGGTILELDYQYDVIGNLREINEGNGRIRRFAVDRETFAADRFRYRYRSVGQRSERRRRYAKLATCRPWLAGLEGRPYLAQRVSAVAKPRTQPWGWLLVREQLPKPQ